jgi:hypothetical protein
MPNAKDDAVRQAHQESAAWNGEPCPHQCVRRMGCTDAFVAPPGRLAADTSGAVAADHIGNLPVDDVSEAGGPEELGGTMPISARKSRHWPASVEECDRER